MLSCLVHEEKKGLLSWRLTASASTFYILNPYNAGCKPVTAPEMNHQKQALVHVRARAEMTLSTIQYLSQSVGPKSEK